MDDGSLDRTSAVVNPIAADHPEVRLIRLAENQGKGQAVRSGVVNAQGKLILFADADGATPLSEVERLEAALDGGADVAIGSRALDDESVKDQGQAVPPGHRPNLPRPRRAADRPARQGHPVRLQALPGAVAHDLFSRMRIRGFSFDVEVLMMAQRRGYGIAEVPVNWTHQPGSKVNLVTDSARMLRDLFVIRGRYLSGQYNSPHLAPWSDSPLESPVAIQR